MLRINIPKHHFEMLKNDPDRSTVPHKKDQHLRLVTFVLDLMMVV